MRLATVEGANLLDALTTNDGSDEQGQRGTDEPEPLVLADGTRIDVRSGEIEKPKRIPIAPPSSYEIIHSDAAVARRVDDLPVPPKQLNAISVVLIYTMLGVNDQAMSDAVGVSIEVIQKIRQSDGYRRVFDAVVEQINESDQEYVRNLFVRGGKVAAAKVLDLVDSENEATAIMAAKDVLDRGGHRPIDVIEHRHRLEGGLKIEIINKSDNSTIPHMEIEQGGDF